MATAPRLESDLLLLLDKSGSMRDTPTGYPGSKWEALRAALTESLTDRQDDFRFGLEFFPTTASLNHPIPRDCGDTDRCCEMPGGTVMNVPIAEAGEASVSRILALLDANEPAGGAPTSVALNRAAAYFDQTQVAGRRYVLLITDGGPNCNPSRSCDVTECTLNLDNVEGCPPDGLSCCNSTPIGCLDLVNAASAVDNLSNLGVTTIVVGLPGSEVYAPVLEQLAVAGGFLRPDGTSVHYQVSADGGVDELTRTLCGILQLLAADATADCRVPLDVNWSAADPERAVVAVDCEYVPYHESAPEDGESASFWRYEPTRPPSALHIEGELCARIAEGEVDRIDVYFGCVPVDL